MNCHYCDCPLSEHNYCTRCGKDMLVYKKLLQASNMYYNEGLEKANVRDLTGAISCLRQSLKLNKNNMQARNLLGLVYFEVGEVVAALSEWVISKNIRAEQNMADDYIHRVQNNGSKLDAINQTMKKYNQALTYCAQDSKDLAVIQLKKVLSLNPRFVQAHQLLALLYIDMQKWELARKELVKCQKIDVNNTLTLRYTQIIVDELSKDEGNKNSLNKIKKDESVRYELDNELIIQPLNSMKTKSGPSSLVNIFIGIMIGVSSIFFLVVPALVEKEQNAAQLQIINLGNELDIKTGNIQDLENTIKSLEEERNYIDMQLQGYIGNDGTLETIDGLLVATIAYVEQTATIEETAEALLEIQNALALETASQSFVDLYNILFQGISPILTVQYYNEGYQFYRTGSYAAAIEKFQWAYYYDEFNEDALYNMANAYRELGKNEDAIATYEKLIELVGGNSVTGQRAQRYIDDLS